MNRNGVIQALRDLYIALDSTPPDEALMAMADMLDSDSAKRQMDEAIKSVQDSYIDIGKELKSAIDAMQTN